MENNIKSKSQSYLWPFILVASLFLLWGFAHSILDVLNKHFQNALEISKARSAMVQFMVYLGYFLMALPAGYIIRHYGYRIGVVVGLALYGIGALMFVPGAQMMSFWFFLFCLFVIGCGLTCLETSANPYITVLGEPERAATRLNLAQSLNGLGWILGPLVGGQIMLSEAEGEAASAGSVAIPYAVIGVVVLVLAVVFSRFKLPEIADVAADSDVAPTTSLWTAPGFVFGVVALFFYVAAQTGINSFYINYVVESPLGISDLTASRLLSIGGMGLFFFGRLFGAMIMRRVKPARLLLFCAAGALACVACVITCSGWLAVVALSTTYLFESIMFPTIFAMAINNVHGPKVATGSSVLVMAIVGGAIAPLLMGWIGDTWNMSVGFIVPLVCFIIITVYSFNRLYAK